MASVLILYCEEGEGHASAARALAAELRERAAEVAVEDALRGGLGRVIPWLSRDAYRLQLRWLKWTYAVEFFLFTRVPPFRALARTGLGLLGSRPLLRAIQRHDPDVVVSTHPAVTNVLGVLRRRRRLRVPVVATITDFGIHPLWVHRDVDLHLVMHDRLQSAVERVAGTARVTVVAPLVDARFADPPAKADARMALGLPESGPVVLISGGGWGVGDVVRAAAVALGVSDLTVVCLAGRNEVLLRKLRREFDGDGRMVVLPFTERMPELLAAADVLVDATVGVTCLEALTAGCPLIVFGAPRGHSRKNAKALRAFGFARHARTERELRGLLAELAGPVRIAAPALDSAGSAADSVLAAELRAHRRRRPSDRVVVAVATVAGALTLAGWTMASPTPYPVLAKTFHLDGMRSVPTRRSEVAILVAADPRAVPSIAEALSRRGVHASFIVSRTLPPSDRDMLRRLSDTVVPAPLPPSGVPGPPTVEYPIRLRQLARQLGLGRPFFYLRPRIGFTLGDYLAARVVGGRLVTPLLVQGWDQASRLRPGLFVMVDATDPRGRESLEVLTEALAAARLAGVSIPELMSSALIARATAGDRASSTAPAIASASPATSIASRT